jgi:tetrahydromethanopterin S-methyltransferase subunit G
MAALDLEKELRDLKRRVDLAETKLSQIDGRFEFITGQLRDVQLYMHARFSDMDERFDKVEGRLDKIDGRLDKIDGRLDNIDGRLDNIDTKVDALPRVIAEMMAGRG